MTNRFGESRSKLKKTQARTLVYDEQSPEFDYVTYGDLSSTTWNDSVNAKTFDYLSFVKIRSPMSLVFRVFLVIFSWSLLAKERARGLDSAAKKSRNDFILCARRNTERHLALENSLSWSDVDVCSWADLCPNPLEVVYSILWSCDLIIHGLENASRWDLILLDPNFYHQGREQDEDASQTEANETTDCSPSC